VTNIQTLAVTVVFNSATHKLGLSVPPYSSAFAYYQDPIGNVEADIYEQPLDGSPACRVSSDDDPTYGTP
jgi:hypothetical protein